MSGGFGIIIVEEICFWGKAYDLALNLTSWKVLKKQVELGLTQ